MTKARFYHAGCRFVFPQNRHFCSICLQMLKSMWFIWENNLIGLLRLKVAGVKSVPALVIDGNVLHINFSAPIEALK